MPEIYLTNQFKKDFLNFLDTSLMYGIQKLLQKIKKLFGMGL